MPGLPYLRKLSLDYFKISVILSLRVLKYGNMSQKSWELNRRTFSFQAFCEDLIFTEQDSQKPFRWCSRQPHHMMKVQTMKQLGGWPNRDDNSDRASGVKISQDVIYVLLLSGFRV